MTGYQVTGIFDDAAFAVQGEEVRVAGATVGSIQSLDVTPDHRAAVTMQITDRRFTPVPRERQLLDSAAVADRREVHRLPARHGGRRRPSSASSRVSGEAPTCCRSPQTHSPVDSDIVQGIYREPVRQQFALIIDELGTGLAARGSDLNSVIHRADPALGYTDQVIQILARQNRQLAQLASRRRHRPRPAGPRPQPDPGLHPHREHDLGGERQPCRRGAGVDSVCSRRSCSSFGR